MQINRTGYFLIALFGGLGLAMCVVPALFGADLETAAIVGSTGAIFVLTAAGLGLYARHAQRKAAHHDWIFRNGIKGTATLLADGSSSATARPCCRNSPCWPTIRWCAGCRPWRRSCRSGSWWAPPW